MTASSFPHLNEPAPDFKALTTHGERTLADYKGKWLILFSHPADFTPVCTTEFIGFAKAADQFKKMNCELLGLSIDSVFSHLTWTQNIKEKFGVTIPFPIIEDIKMEVAGAYGMVHPGAADTQAVRATFFIDPNGVLRAMVYYPMSNGRSIDEFVRLLQAMQASDTNKVATPEGWKPGDDVIVPAPKTHDTIAKRQAEGLNTVAGTSRPRSSEPSQSRGGGCHLAFQSCSGVIAVSKAGRLFVESLFDEATSTFSHIVLDRETMQCAVVDSVLDFDPKSGRTALTSADRLVSRVSELGAQVQWLLETHVHADHLSAAPYLQRQLGGQIGIGSHIVTVQETFGKIFNAGTEFQRDGSQFDHLFEDGDRFAIGGLAARALHTPGHTPACMTYVVDDGDEHVAFVGDTLFMPDYGTARCDFPGGDAAELYRSIRKVLALPPQTRLYLCHDYAPGGRPVQPVCTVAEQRAANVHVHEGVSEAEFVAMRRTRDATLAMPQLILPSVQVNMRAGRLPPAEQNGVCYLKIPVDVL